MAAVTVDPPKFSGGIEDDIEQFTRLFRGFLHSLNINPVGAVGRAQALGMLRNYLKGEAASWYDEEILGKNWKLNNIFDNHGTNTVALLQAQNMGQMNGNASFRPHSLAHVFAHVGANGAVLVGSANANMLRHEEFDEDWWTNSGGEPTDEPANIGAGNNNPIVLPGIRIGQAIYHLRNKYPTILEERRKIQFGNLEQGNEPVKTFYKKIQRYAKLLNFGNEVIEHQFYRGISPDNMLEVERIGAERSLTETVNILEKVEKRKSEMRLGLSNRNRNIDNQSQLQSQVTQQLSSSSSGYSPAEVDKMIKNATEKITQNFQTQIQNLQSQIPAVPISQNLNIIQDNVNYSTKNNEIQKRNRPRESYADEQRRLEAEYKELADEWDSVMHHQPRKPPIVNEYHMEQARRFANLSGAKYPDAHNNIDKIAYRIAERLEQKKLDKEIANLTGGIGNININDPDAMETNLVRNIETATDDDDEYTLQLIRKKK